MTRRGEAARIGLAVALTAVLGCSREPAEGAVGRAGGRAPVVAQGRPPPPPAPTPEIDELELEAKIRAQQTRVGEAVRVHVTLWRPAAGSSEALVPTLDAEGPAAIEIVGREIVETRADLLRERFDFRVEPGGVGVATLTVTIPGRPERETLRLEITAALAQAELDRMLSSHVGRLERGRALARQGDYRRAIAVFRLALDEQPEDAALLGELGWAAFLAGEQLLGRRATREALRLEDAPSARGAMLYNLGRIAEALGRDDEALADYRRSLRIRPGSAIVRERLARLEHRHPAASDCAAELCPLAGPVAPLRACELIEEEGCHLFASPSHCRCELDGLDELGPWRLLTLTEPGDGGELGRVYFLLEQLEQEVDPAEAEPEAELEPRFRVFPPLLASRTLGGPIHAGIASAERITTGNLDVLRIDFSGALHPDATPGVTRELAWTLLCGDDGTRAACAAPLLTALDLGAGARLLAPVQIELDGGRIVQTADRAPPDPAIELLVGRARVLDEPRELAQLLFDPAR